MAEKLLTYDEMVDKGVRAIIRSFGKGEDLRGAVAYIVQATSQWTANNLEAKKDDHKKRHF